MSGMAKLVHAAFFTYLLSYALPAVVIAGDFTFGFLAAFLSFIGSFIGLVNGGDLERGQVPACFCGAVANLLMFAGYVCYHLRRFSKKSRFFCSVASLLAGGAAVCALGAAVFLATGSESFVPLVGFFVWLASMVIISFAYFKLGLTVKCEPDTPTHDDPTMQIKCSGIPEEPVHSMVIPEKGPTKRPHWLIWAIPILVLVLIIVLAGNMFLQHQHMMEVDERIINEVENALILKLRSLPEDDDITQKYGKFIKLSNVHWDRPGYAFQLIIRLDWSATAHFEKAQVHITLGIDKGETVEIERLRMGSAVQAGNTIFTLDGWAKHPDFLHDSQDRAPERDAADPDVDAELDVNTKSDVDPEKQAEAIAMIERLRGKVERDLKHPDQPVVEIRISHA